MESDQRQKLMNYAYFYLNIRPRTVKELRDYLMKKATRFNIPVEITSNVVDRLIELNLLDDHEFTRWYVEGKYASARKSVFLLKRELSRLGVQKNIIDDYFARGGIDEIAAARDALSPKWRRLGGLHEKNERFRRAAAFLGRKGFSYDIIKKTIAEFEGDE